jgi:hypothetical protein
MFRFRQARDVALVLFFAFIATNVYAKSSNQDDGETDLASGILLDRLSPKHQKTWQAIRQIIYAEDVHGRALHPLLRGLFEQLDTSGHSIYLEFDDRRKGCRSIAGQFSIERLDPEGSRNVVVIKLYLRNIEEAAAPPQANLKDDFTPLAGLNKQDRFVEVFGHEMAHAVDILFTRELANVLDQVLRKSDQVIQQCLRRKGKIEPEMARVLEERDFFLNELENSARNAETMIWRELVESRRKRRT